MTLEHYLKLRNKGKTLGQLQDLYCLSESTAYTLELGYQCYLKKLPLDQAIEIIQEVEI